MNPLLAACIILLGLTTPVSAQMPVVKNLNPPPVTKIAVVNVQVVLREYWKAKTFKDQMEKSLKEPKAKAKRLMDEMAEWERTLREQRLPDREKYEDAIFKHKCEFDRMDQEIRKSLGKKSQESEVILWKDINASIKARAEAFGFHIVLGHSMPDREKEMFSLRSRNPQLMGIDSGFAVPLHIAGSADITQSVIQSLNLSESRQPAVKRIEGGR